MTWPNPSVYLRAGKKIRRILLRVKLWKDTVNFMNGQNRGDVKIGLEVEVVLRANQKTGKLTHGIVAEILTNSSFNPRGIKVRLENGKVGRVQNILPLTRLG